MLTALHNTVLIIVFLCIITAVHAKKTTPHFSQEKNGITVFVHSLSKSELRTLFNCYNPVKIVRLTNHYKALEITIENKTAQDYVLDQNNIDLKLENTLIIKEKVKTNPVLLPLATGIGVSALLISGIGFAVVPSIIVSTAIGLTTLNLNMQKSNKISTQNIRTKVLDANHPALTASFSKTQKIIFIASKNMKRNFCVGLESLHSTQKIIFDIRLKK